MIEEEQLKARFGISDVTAFYQQIRSREAFIAFTRHFHNADPHIARNAAWIMTQCTNSEAQWLQEKKDELIDIVLTTENVALRRLVLNLLERQSYDADSIRSDFLDFCLDGMASLDEPPGVQSLCMKLANKMCALYPELHEEFMNILYNMDTDFYKPGLRSVRTKILKGK